ncbi:MAG: serine/threonine-protein kinase [Myxococcales bacterium]|nr:serine/threonine protein kinase [Myxococcota bacterium]MDW8281487.1 serine/threonine-protein kinase [Myxococcales bacterium]
MPTTIEPQEAASASTPGEPQASPARSPEDLVGGSLGDEPEEETEAGEDPKEEARPASAVEPEPVLRGPRTDPDPEPPRVDPYLGTVVAGRYRIQGKIGEGGMGAVYLAEHEAIERKVAIKILAQDFARKADLVQRFLQEARAAARIGHENIVEVYDFGETDSGSVFFVMEYLVGQDLAQLIRTHAPLPAPRVRHIAGQICRALGAAHSKQIIHRDLKPENIFLVERDGRTDVVKVLDFGIAKFSNIEEDKGRLTRTGMIFGTPEYMSPEQARGDPPDHRVDIYALGCILYEMVTGTVPFSADTFMGVLTKHMFEPVEPPSRRARVAVPRDLEEIILRALDKDRDRRFQTMQELAQALEAEGTASSGPVVVSSVSQRSIPPSATSYPPPSGESSPRTTSPLPVPQPYPPAPASVQSLVPPLAYPMPLAVPAGYLHPGMEPGTQPHAPSGARRLAVIGGTALVVLALAAVLFKLIQPSTQPVALAGGSVQPEPPTQPAPPTQAQPPMPPTPTVRPPAVLILTGTPGAHVELLGRERGEIPPRGPLRIELDTGEKSELRALLVVRKRDHQEESREVILVAGKETVQEVNLLPRRRRQARESRDVARPVEEPQRPVTPPTPASTLRNPFLRSGDLAPKN